MFKAENFVRSKNKKNTGFTLIELLVVISIISLLASVVMASLNSARAKARDTKRMQDLVQMRSALEAYYSDNGSYPVTGGGIWYSTCDYWSGLKTISGASGYIPNLAPNYIKSLPLDPLRGSKITSLKPTQGNEGNYAYCYIYQSDGVDYKIASHCSVEGSPASSGKPFWKGGANWFCGDYHFALYTKGAQDW